MCGLCALTLCLGSVCRFSWGLGMPTVAKSDQSTGNGIFASYVLKSNDLTFVLTAPYSRTVDKTNSRPALPWYKQDEAYAFLNKHGLAVKSVGRCLPRRHGRLL